jgi:N-acetylmuramic acid 6-phosphate etherase
VNESLTQLSDALLTQYANLPTEQPNPNTQQLDELPTIGILQAINAEDKTVAFAVEQALPQIVPVVEAVAKAFQAGGRLFYVGAGTSGRLGVLDAVECPPTFSVEPTLVQGIIAGGERAICHAVEGAEDDALAGQQAMLIAGITAKDVVVRQPLSKHNSGGPLRRVLRVLQVACCLLWCRHPLLYLLGQKC